MAYDAVLGKQEFKAATQVIDFSHPPIVQAMKVKANQGELSAGLIVALDANGEVVPYDSAGSSPVNEPVGILVYGIDTSKETVGNVLRHGVAVKASLKVGDNPPTANDLKALEAKGIYVV
ncbi:MAG: hypothetical protein QXV82_09625 [Ignisphaera sp.]